jgi:hypothetical protein
VLPPHDLFQIPLQAHQLRRGDNRLSVARIETTGTSEVVVQEFEVHVTPPAP